MQMFPVPACHQGPRPRPPPSSLRRHGGGPRDEGAQSDLGPLRATPTRVTWPQGGLGVPAPSCWSLGGGFLYKFPPRHVPRAHSVASSSGKWSCLKSKGLQGQTGPKHLSSPKPQRPGSKGQAQGEWTTPSPPPWCCHTGEAASRALPVPWLSGPRIKALGWPPQPAALPEPWGAPLQGVGMWGP